MATGAFNTDSTASALDDTTNNASGTNGNRNEEAYATARDKGWVEPQSFDYESHNAPIKASGANEGDWNHHAAKYEWKEDYGEVGPAIPELEHQLFRSEFINRQGVKFNE